MPNYSDTYIEFNGNKEVISKLYSKIKTKGLIVDSEFEIPNDLNEKSDWFYENWGTKVNSLSPEENGEKSEYLTTLKIIDKTKLIISFYSFWCGPSIWFKKVCQKYNLSGEYSDIEGSSDFFHSIQCKNYEVIQEIEDNYFSQPSIDYYGIDFFKYKVDDLEDINNLFEDDLDLLLKNGYSVDEIEKIIKSNNI